jgi:hypothetical protein
VQASDPAVVELREWSRLAEELQQERVRLGNRVRQQLWRYYPQLLELADDVAAEWVLALWAMAPTPAKAARLREATLARLLKRHRIRRVDAETASASCAGPRSRWPRASPKRPSCIVRSLVARLRLANREFRQAERKLDELCAALSETASATRTAGQATRPSSPPCPGSAGARSPPCSPRRPGRSAAGTTPRSGPCPAWRR